MVKILKNLKSHKNKFWVSFILKAPHTNIFLSMPNQEELTGTCWKIRTSNHRIQREYPSCTYPTKSQNTLIKLWTIKNYTNSSLYFIFCSFFPFLPLLHTQITLTSQHHIITLGIYWCSHRRSHFRPLPWVKQL